MPANANLRSPVSTLCTVLLAVAACSTPDPDSARGDARTASGKAPEAEASRPSPERLLPWTDAFDKSAVLLASEIRVEGPVGLIAHIATVSNSEELDRTEKATPDGFLQVISVKPQAHGAQINAQLDRLAMVALHRLSVLERPGATAVVVDAKGDVYWAETESKQEKHAETLHLDGKIAQGEARPR